MAITGDLREASLPDVLQLLALGQKTGCLAITDRRNFGYVYFERGWITYASIVNRRDRLGEFLLKNGVVGQDELHAAVAAQNARGGASLDQVLLERGTVSREQVEKFVRMQVEEAVYYLFTWSQGTFTFEPEQRVAEGATQVHINPESLLLEGARRVDEWSQIEKRIPSLDLVFAVVPGRNGASQELSPEQRGVLRLLDGKRSVQEIIDESGLVEFDVGKALFGLIEAGRVRASGRKPPRWAAGDPQRTQEHRNLGIAFYRTGMLDEARREFGRVIETLPDDLAAHFYLGLIELRAGDPRAAYREIRGVLARGGRWASCFFNLSLALEGMGRPKDALMAVQEGLRLSPRHPAALLSRGLLLARLGRIDEARDAFAEYREALGADERPAAAYYAYAALVLGALGRADAGWELCEEGLAQHPHSAVLLLHAGALRERAGFSDQAAELYARAVEEEPDLPQARKALGDVLLAQGALEEAAAQYRRVVELRPGLGDDVYLKLGDIAYRKGERDAAVRLWTVAVERNPQNGVARTQLELVTRVGGSG